MLNAICDVQSIKEIYIILWSFLSEVDPCLLYGGSVVPHFFFQNLNNLHGILLYFFHTNSKSI